MKLFFDTVKDFVVKTALRQIENEYNENKLNMGNFQFIEIEVFKVETNMQIKHPLGFIPQDVIMTSVIPAQTVTWKYATFDKTYMYIACTGACKIRAFIGAYGEEQ